MILGILVDAHWFHDLINVRCSLTADLQTSHLVLSVPKAEVANST